MAGKVLNKFMDIFCLNDDMYDMDDELENEDFEDEDVKSEFNGIDSIPRSSEKNSKVINLPINSKNNLPKQKVIIVKPYDFEEAASICDHLKSNKIAVVNTTALDNKVGQRLLDFVGGATYVLGVQIREVEKGIYMFIPSNVEISNSFKEELQNKSVFSFMK